MEAESMRSFLEDSGWVQLHPAGRCSMKDFFAVFDRWCLEQNRVLGGKIGHRRWKAVWEPLEVHCTPGRNLSGVCIREEQDQALLMGEGDKDDRFFGGGG
jgi:hypothetical protein